MKYNESNGFQWLNRIEQFQKFGIGSIGSMGWIKQKQIESKSNELNCNNRELYWWNWNECNIMRNKNGSWQHKNIIKNCQTKGIAVSSTLCRIAVNESLWSK